MLKDLLELLGLGDHSNYLHEETPPATFEWIDLIYPRCVRVALGDRLSLSETAKLDSCGQGYTESEASRYSAFHPAEASRTT